MGVDAFAIAGASLATIVIAKIKFYVKKNGVWTCGCGFMDKPLIDDDEIEIKQFELSDNVKGIYVCLLYTSPSPRDLSTSRMPSSA